MTSSTDNQPPCAISARAVTWLAATAVTATVLAGLAAAGLSGLLHLPTGVGPLLGAVLGLCGYGYLSTRSEERVLAKIEHMASDMWWHGYATCLEDTADGPARRVVPFRRGDRSGDTHRSMNGSELI